MSRGSCLCGGVRFEFDRVVGPFELCHCNRCRKVSGSAFVAGVGVATDGFRFESGTDLIRSFELPCVERPPPYRTSFCSRCGSPLPTSNPNADVVEIPAGLLDTDPGAQPDKHIFVHVKAPWYTIEDELPQMDDEALRELRARGG